jgi:hypothetical protein
MPDDSEKDRPPNPMSNRTNDSYTAGRAGNWEEHQKPRAYHRAGAFLGLVTLRTLTWIGFCYCAFVLVSAFLMDNGPERRALFLRALIVLIAAVTCRVVGWAQERTLRCSLCNGTPLHDKSCRMHKKAVKIPLIGYSGATVLSTLCTGKFRCIYCGTPFRLRK